MKLKLSLLLVTIMAFFNLSAEESPFKKPDFAYPKQVMATWNKELDRGLKTGDGQLIMRSLLNVGMAENAISPKNKAKFIETLRSTAKNKKVSEQDKALMLLLEAEIYSSIYTPKYWKFDQRDIPLTPLPADIEEWSGEQFRTKIMELADSVLTYTSSLAKTPISDYKGVIKPSDYPALYPTLFDFAAYKLTEILSYHTFQTTPEALNIVTSIYDRLLANHPAGSAPHFLAEVNSIGRNGTDYQQQCRELFDLGIKNIDSPYSALALLKANGYNSRKLYFAYEDYLKKHSESLLATEVRNRMENLVIPSVSYKYVTKVGKGKVVNVSLTLRNAPDVKVSLYSLKQIPEKRNRKYALDKLISDTIVHTDIHGPFEIEKSVGVTVPEYGLYTILVTVDGDKPETDMSYNVIYCSDIFLMAIAHGKLSEPQTFTTFAADITTGKPVPDVLAWGDSLKKNNNLILSGTTNKEGYTDIHGQDYIHAKKGTDIYPEPLKIYDGYDKPSPARYASVTTDLPLYHFGDTVRWAAFIYESNDSAMRKPLSGEKVTVQLMSPFHKQINSMEVTADFWGRATGEFLLPVTTQAGSYYINVLQGSTRLGSSSVTVSDYKLPTFTVQFTDIKRDFPAQGDITVTGVATTYSGFPVSDAKVAAEILATTRRTWWESSRIVIDNLELTTDSNGNFTIVISAESLKAHNNGAVEVNAIVTSPGGESRSNSTIFTTGKPYSVRAEIPRNLDVEKPVNLNIELISPSMAQTTAPVVVKLFEYVNPITPATENMYSSEQEDETVMDEEEKTDETTGKPLFTFILDKNSSDIDLTDVPSGNYTIEIAPVDSTLAEPFTSNSVFIYKNSQKDFPLENRLWCPISNYGKMNISGQDTTLLLGTSYNDFTLLMAVTTPEKILFHKWITLKKGMNRIPLHLPDGVGKATVSFSGANNGNLTKHSFDVITPAERNQLEFTIESFRDKVVPNTPEKWTFRTRSIRGYDTMPTQSAVILRMISKAVNDISSMRPVSFRDASLPSATRFYGNASYLKTGSYWGDSKYPYRNLEITTPEFELYGNTWYTLMIRGSRAMMRNAVSSDELAVVREYKSEATVAMGSMNYDSGAIEEAAIEAESSASTVSDNFRPAEIPLALFEPTLTTTPDGQLEFSFTFPDASTTWLLDATAYTSDMTAASFSKEIVASHPLMIQTSLPRFLRLGDRAVLNATVMNNTDSLMTGIATRFEAIDPATGSVMAFAEETIQLDPMSMKVLTLPMFIDRLTPGMLIRAKASTSRFSDGEQAVIAILEASQPVVETRTFFLNDSQKSVSLDVNTSESAKVTLEFYQNPTWSVVTALPGLRSAPYSTPADAAAAITSAAIAENLINRYPEIGTAIRQWLASDQSDSTLVSALQRNPDLKIALLEATPWMTDAMNDTQRMQRLALLFDRKEINNVYTAAIHQLAKLQRSKGWAWTESYDKSSYWATLQTLEMLGYLKSLGCLPQNKQLDDMIRNAIEYVDSEAVELTRLKNGRVAPDTYYTLVRTPFTDIRQSSAARRITEVTVQHLLAKWKTFSLRNKAFAAIILAQNNYHSSARAIVGSIAEFALESPEKGMWWDNEGIGTSARILQAYTLTSQPVEQINAIRQWLIIEKAANNWGTSADATCVIYNILASGTKWTALSPGSAVITVDSKEVTPNRIDNITGYFRTDISALITGNPSQVQIIRTGSTPAYGAIYSVGIQPMNSIKAVGCDELTINKRFLVKDTETDRTQWVEATSFHVGDVVKVSLTLKVKANMQYVVITDNRPACLEPVNQLPEKIWSENLFFYRQTGDSASDIFINNLPEGTYILEQEFTVTHPGEFTSGIATVQSQYAPQYTAHSQGYILETAK